MANKASYFIAILCLFMVIVGGWVGTSNAEMNGYIAGSGVASDDCAGGSDGAMGYTAATGGEVGIGTANQLYYQYFTPTEDGTVSKAHAWKYGNSGYYRIGIWSETGKLLGSTSATGTGGGDSSLAAVHSALDDSVCLDESTTYILGLWVSDFWNGPGISGWISSNLQERYSQTLSTFGDFTPEDANGPNSNNLVITVNNSESTF